MIKMASIAAKGKKTMKGGRKGSQMHPDNGSRFTHIMTLELSPEKLDL